MRTLPHCIFTASTLDGIYYEQHDEDFERLQVEGYHNQIHLVKDVTKEPVEIQKLAIYRNAGIAQIGDAVKERWKDTFRVFQAGECWIDFVDPAADKGNALKELQKILGIRPEENMAFGDNFNDIGMFQQAGESYAVANAADGVNDLLCRIHINENVSVNIKAEEGLDKLLSHLFDRVAAVI